MKKLSTLFLISACFIDFFTYALTAMF